MSGETQSKQRQYSQSYTQVKVSVAPEVASAFKAACAASDVSMAETLSKCKKQALFSELWKGVFSEARKGEFSEFRREEFFEVWKGEFSGGRSL